MVAGTFFTPSIFEAYLEGDWRLVGCVVAFVVASAVTTPLVIAEGRRVFRADDGGPLILLGAGTQLISAAQDKALRSRSVRAFGSKAQLSGGVVYTLMFAYPLVTGAGVHGPIQNRLSALALWLYCVLGASVLAAWPVALQLATTLIDARTNAIRAAIARERGGEGPRTSVRVRADDQHWETQVVSRCRELVEVLGVLSDNFKRPLWLQLLDSLVSIGALLCLLLSDYFASIDGKLAVGLLVIFVAVYEILYPSTQVAVLLGAVSTSCDDLTEDLNTLRLQSLTRETHTRVLMLETALKVSARSPARLSAGRCCWRVADQNVGSGPFRPPAPRHER